MKITVTTTIAASMAEVDLRVGGKFCSRMEAKDGSFGFDFAGKYTKLIPHQLIEYVFDERKVSVNFTEGSDDVLVKVSFDPETIHPEEQQREGWQAILDNFAKYVSERRS